MNRQIKFRVWDKHLNRFIPFHSIGKVDFNDETYVFQQFTGLQDKNGKDIWEGDIIKMDIKNGIVQFVNGGFRHDAESAYNSGLYWTEVIGNIFENPELLQK